jgi:chromosomal replication initiator protein
MTNEELWEAALGEIELLISRANFSTWFKNTTILSNENGKVVIGVPNGFAKEWLENKYRHYILESLRHFRQDIKELSCSIYNYQEPESARQVDAVRPTAASKRMSSFPANFAKISQESNLNPRYLFENFIIGESNELARAACFAVSQNLGRVYNPLFIYGGVGLGKTHLLQSIGNEVIKNSSPKKIKYITSERFANGLIESIKNQSTNQFKEEYQKIDLLIIDDIQFLAGKEKTQNEFFHIFNALYQLNKQIVISSDRPPKSIPTIEERLRSRFEGGMITDIGKPDLETRMAILKAKLAERDFAVKEEVLHYIAENVKNNVRELEGALNRVIAQYELNQIQPDIPFIKNILSEIISSGKKAGVQSINIIKTVCDFYNIDDKKLASKIRKRELVRARQVAMYLIRKEINTSYPTIGELFGGRDHTTALHAYEKIEQDLEKDERLKEEVNTIMDRLYMP